MSLFQKILVIVCFVGVPWALWGQTASSPVSENGVVMTLPMLLACFLLAGGVVSAAGVTLTKAGDELGDRLNLGGSWVGLVVLSAVTSMPELVSTIGSAVFENQPAMAAGNVFGSNSFNVFIIVLLDLYYRGGPITYMFGMMPAFSASLGIAMTAIGAVALLLSSQALFPNPVFPVWVWTLLIFASYFLFMLLIFRSEKKLSLESRGREEESSVNAAVVGDAGWKTLILRLVVSAAIVVVAGYLLVVLADRLAVYPFSFGMLGHSFLGTLGLALATSLPELVVGITAIRLKNFDMVAGNIFGSNIFNIMILAVCHLCYEARYSQSFYSACVGGEGAMNLFTALLAMVLASLAIAGMMHRSRRTLLGVGWDSIAIGIVYMVGIYWLYLGGR
ncbi:MAG: hypothetical protein KC994_00145 [Candidatus Omnitrophica bacterium]|nr:hypothetical protein [Candidatus Omnitrophota bacterium]